MYGSSKSTVIYSAVLLPNTHRNTRGWFQWGVTIYVYIEDIDMEMNVDIDVGVQVQVLYDAGSVLDGFLTETETIASHWSNIG